MRRFSIALILPLLLASWPTPARTPGIHFPDSGASPVGNFQNDTTSRVSQNDTTFRDFGNNTTFHVSSNDTIAAAVKIDDYIRHRGSGMIVAVKSNPEAKNKSTLEFLSVLPGVQGININGKADVAKVFVNGREMKLSPDEMRRYLSGIRAEDVRQIQILPTHGAKYSADSRGGIIRIQLRSREEEQISGSAVVPLGLNTDNTSLSVSPSVSLNYLSKKISSYTYASGTWLQDERTEGRKLQHRDGGGRDGGVERHRQGILQFHGRSEPALDRQGQARNRPCGERDGQASGMELRQDTQRQQHRPEHRSLPHRRDALLQLELR